MFIQKLSVKNVRGVTGSWELAPATVIIGDNFAGKSGLLNAIKLLIFRYLPHPRKDTKVNPMDLASGNEMSIHGELSDGRVIDLNWRRDKSGKVTQNHSPELDLAQTILLDPKQYFDASSNKRMQFVFESVKLSGDQTPEALLAEIANVKLEENTEASESALRDLLTSIRAWIQSGGSVQEQVQYILERVQDSMKLAKQTVDRMAKTIGGLTELAAKKPQDFDNELSEIDQQLRAKRTELATLQQQSGAVEADIKQIAGKAALKESLEKKIAVEFTVVAGIKLHEQTIANASLTEPLIDYTAQLDALKDEGSALSLALTSAQNALVAAKGDVKSIEDKRSVIGFAVTRSRASIERLQKEKEVALAHENCPFCNAPGTDFRKRVADDFDKRILEFASELNTNNAELEATIPELQKAREAVIMAENAIAPAESALKAKREEYSAVIQKRDAQVHARTKLLNDKSAAEQAIVFLKQQLADIEQAKKDLAGLTVEDASTLQAKLIAINGFVADTNNSIRALDSRRNQAIAAKASVVQQQQALEERKKAEADLAIHKAVVEVVTAFQGRMVDQAFGSLITVANKFTEDLLDAPLQYRDGEVGRMRGGLWVPNDQFSDSEQIITYAAMSVALGATSPFRVVLVDELTRVRGVRKTAIIQRMLDLESLKVIDQAVCVDVQTDDGQIPEYYRLEDARVSVIHLKK